MPRVSKLHALTWYEPILAFANAKVTEDNYLYLAFGFMPESRRKGIEIGVLGIVSDISQLRIEGDKAYSPFPIPYEVIKAIEKRDFAPRAGDTVESVLRGCYKLALRSVERATVATLGERIALVLARHVEGDPEPLRGGIDFVVRDRHPLGHPAVIRAADGAFDPDSNDLHDIWYGMLSSLLANLTEGRPVTSVRRGRRMVLPFRPLARCPVCKCFYFRAGGPRQLTCSARRCVNRHAHSPRPKPPRVPSQPA